MLVTSMLSSADQEILARANDRISASDWDGLYTQIKSASHYCMSLLLEHLRSEGVAAQIKHEGIHELLENCTAVPSDFEELGRPAKEKINLDLRHFGSPFMHAISDGRRVILQDHETLRVIETAEIISHESNEEHRSTGFHHLPPFKTGTVTVAPGGEYYLVYKEPRHSPDGREVEEVYKAGQADPVFVFDSGERVEFISAHELLLRRYYKSERAEYGGFSYAPLNPPEIFILNLETAEKVDCVNRPEWALAQEFKIKAASRDGSVILIQESRSELHGCCPHEYVRFRVRVGSGRGSFVDHRFGDEFPEGGGAKTEAHLSSDGRRMLIFRTDLIQIWDWETATLVENLKLGWDMDRKMVFDPVNDLIAISGDYELVIFSVKTTKECVKISEHKPHEILFVDGYLLSDGWNGWTAFALGARSDKNWEAALELRRISLSSPEQITQEKKDYVRVLSETESWLSPAQSRFLRSLSYFANKLER